MFLRSPTLLSSILDEQDQSAESTNKLAEELPFAGKEDEHQPRGERTFYIPTKFIQKELCLF